MTAAEKIEFECARVRKAIVDLQHDIEIKRAELRGLLLALDAVRVPGERLESGADLPTETDVRNPIHPKASALVDEILLDLERLTVDFPKGPTVKQIAEFLGEEEANVRKACHALNKEKRAVFMRRSDSPSYHLFPIGRKPPAAELTRAQAAVLRVLHQYSDEHGLVQKPIRTLVEAADVSKGSFGTVISALLSKKRIEIAANGSNSEPNIYRVLELPQSAAQAGLGMEGDRT